MTDPSSHDLALHFARAVDDKGGEDLAVLHLGAGGLTDYAVIATGRSDRQVHTLVDECLHLCKLHGISHRHLEGETGWMVLDCMDVAIHALTEEMRQFYRLERLWPQATVIDWQAELKKLPRLAGGARAGGVDG